MQHLGYLSLHKWCDDLASDSLLQYLVGSFSPPSVASHYDFIVRLTGVDSHMNELFPKAHFKKIKDKKPKKGEKLINYSHSDTYYLLDKYKDGADSFYRFWFHRQEQPYPFSGWFFFAHPLFSFWSQGFRW